MRPQKGGKKKRRKPAKGGAPKPTKPPKKATGKKKGKKEPEEKAQAAEGEKEKQVAGGEEAAAPAAGEDLISFDEFVQAVTTANKNEQYPAPDKSKFEALVSQAEEKGGITTKQELAMFLTHAIWETGGLQYPEELACSETGCPGAYPNKDVANTKSYYGRGYLQLTWDYNYEEASQDIYGDLRLIDAPESVGKDDNVAWVTALWFWKKRIHDDPGVAAGHFGATTNIINGGLECAEPGNIKAETRFKIYSNVLKCFGISEEPNPEGCKRW